MQYPLISNHYQPAVIADNSTVCSHHQPSVTMNINVHGYIHHVNPIIIIYESGVINQILGIFLSNHHVYHRISHQITIKYPS